MGAVHLTDALIRGLPAPERGNKIVYDDTVTGLGIRVTAAGHKAFILGYTVRGSGRQRRFTIGDFGDWTTKTARDRARELRAEIDQGGDPLAAIEAEREAPTMADLIARFEAEHLVRLQPNTATDYRFMIKNHVAPHFDNRKVQEIVFADCDRLHHKITKAGHSYRANRVLALTSKMFSLAIRWGWRTDNPCKGVERNVEHNRERYLTDDEQARLNEALAKADRDVADVIRLLLLTGARRGEVLSMKWTHVVPIAEGVWRKPPAAGKTKKVNEVPLSPPAQQILAARYVDGAEFVFPGNGSKHHVVNIQRSWQRICKAAGIKHLRLHDLRHSFASSLVTAGYSLPMIGSLLGHKNVQTTSRYAHLYRDARREAVERVAAAVTNAGKEARPPAALKRGGRS